MVEGSQMLDFVHTIGAGITLLALVLGISAVMDFAIKNARRSLYRDKKYERRLERAAERQGCKIRT